MIDLAKVSSVVVQGMTGANGAFHTERMLAYGTPIVAGVTPGKAGQTLYDVPIYDRVADAVATHGQIDASVIFVPAKFAKSAILEALDAQIPLIVIITEGIPVHDMLQISQHKHRQGSVIVGPNCPGVLVPGRYLLGIIPTSIALPGNTAIISRSGTLTYEAIDGLTRRQYGQYAVVGIGGDRVAGSDFTTWLQVFEQAADVERIVMIGEIGGTTEIAAAEYISQMNTPVYAYIAGHSAPAGVQLGHAGALLGSNQLETAGAKNAALAGAGAITADTLPDLLDKLV